MTKRTTFVSINGKVYYVNGLPSKEGSKIPSVDFTKSFGMDDYEMEKIPRGILALKRLESLNLTGCEKLKELPDSISELKELKFLNLTNCKSLKMLPDSISELKELKFLHLIKCKSLKTLPDSISSLKNLIAIDLAGCNNLIFTKDLRKNLDDLRKNGCFVYYPESELKYNDQNKDGVRVRFSDKEGSPATSPRGTRTEVRSILKRGSRYQEESAQLLRNSLSPQFPPGKYK